MITLSRSSLAKSFSRLFLRAAIINLAVVVLLTSCVSNRSKNNPFLAKSIKPGQASSSPVASTGMARISERSLQNAIAEQDLVKSVSNELVPASKQVVFKAPFGLNFEFANSNLKIGNSASLNSSAQAEIVEQILVSGITPEIKFDSFMLENPKRVVLDLFKEGSISPKNLKVNNSKFIESFRIGSHPDKQRVVLDLKDAQKNLAFEIRQANQTLSVNIAPDTTIAKLKGVNSFAKNQIGSEELKAQELDPILKAFEQQSSKTAMPATPAANTKDLRAEIAKAKADIDQQLILTGKKPVLQKELEVEQKPLAVVKLAGAEKLNKEVSVFKVAVPKLESEAKHEKGVAKIENPKNLIKNSPKNLAPELVKATVENKKEELIDVAQNQNEPLFKRREKADLSLLKFEKILGETNAVRFGVSEARFYTFEQVAPREYKLLLNNTKVSKAIKPLMAPDTKGSIRSVRTNETAENTEIRITTEPKTILTANADGASIVVSAVNYQAAQQMRAQPNFDKLKEEVADLKQQVEDKNKAEKKIADELKEEVLKPNMDKNSVKETAASPEVKPEAKKPVPTEEAKTGVKEEVKKEVKAEQELAPVKNQKKEPKADKVEEIKELDLVPAEDELTEFFTVDQKYTGRLISLDLQDTEIDNALRIIAEVSNLNIISSDEVTGKVTLRLIDVPWDQALDVILKSNGLDKVQEGNVIRIAPVEKLRSEREALKQAQQAEEELEPLQVQYLRVSYAKAAELQPLIETVITERGTVAFDERSNQIIVKDIAKGLKNVARLVEKLDLRTPQVLIETQIVEASRSFVRELGSELGFFFLRSPETGNATNLNFPNSIEIGGSAANSSGTGASVKPNFSFFPASNQSSAVSALFGSADGTKGLQLRLTQAETEGDVRTISRPSVAVTNNSPAVIKSVTKLRIKLPAGGASIASGQGAATTPNTVAAQTIEVGIVLNVTAQASPDYYVLMDIQAKSSTLGPLALGVDQIPPEIERSATSSVLVSSGQTFAMGGIYRISEDDNTVGVPFMKNVPFFGQFFRRSVVDNDDEELIFFITPRIIEGSFDDASMK